MGMLHGNAPTRWSLTNRRRHHLEDLFKESWGKGTDRPGTFSTDAFPSRINWETNACAEEEGLQASAAAAYIPSLCVSRVASWSNEPA